jgi:hypothetical protein
MGWKVGSQPLVVDFQAGCLVEDAGLIAVRDLDVSLGVLSELAWIAHGGGLDCPD